jgi:carnitine O-acetyltransferase
MKRAYLQWRAPLVVNSNWWLALNNDPTISVSAPHEAPQQINPLQVRRTAWILHRFLDFKYRLER